MDLEKKIETMVGRRIKIWGGGGTKNIAKEVRQRVRYKEKENRIYWRGRG